MQKPSDLPAPPPLRELSAEGPLALFLDFDGTLVDLADTPDGILVPEGLADRLAGLSALHDHAVALVSGRAVIDLERHCGRLEIARAGSHGIDRRFADGSTLGDTPVPMSQDAEDCLRQFASENDLRLETKPHGGALHFRANPTAEPAGLEFATRLAAEHGLAVKRGKFVIELVRPGADKGGAVRAFMQKPPFAGRRPVFVGDDITDEDGFIAAQELGGLGIVVGDRGSTAANYRLADPIAVYDWLDI